ncbi:MAG: class I SAM-dependent methyltransferase [Ignavibacteriaceae bacterium]|nr:class I SAM-dependent methyltransferase [Ignavibacteriaceae bacterium]
MKEMWNDRYASDTFIFGTKPNEFFKMQLDTLPSGKLLLFGEGEGRNAVYAASIGWDTVALDWSEKAKEKALTFAKQNNVLIEYHVGNFLEIPIESNSFDAVALIYIHLVEETRERLHKKAIESLKPGGTIIFEAFEQDQLGRTSGGPQNIALLYSLENIVNDFQDLDFKYFAKETLQLDEGDGHRGEAFVIRFTGIKKQ